MNDEYVSNITIDNIKVDDQIAIVRKCPWYVKLYSHKDRILFEKGVVTRISAKYIIINNLYKERKIRIAKHLVLRVHVS